VGAGAAVVLLPLLRVSWQPGGGGAWVRRLGSCCQSPGVCHSTGLLLRADAAAVVLLLGVDRGGA